MSSWFNDKKCWGEAHAWLMSPIFWASWYLDDQIIKPLSCAMVKLFYNEGPICWFVGILIINPLGHRDFFLAKLLVCEPFNYQSIGPSGLQLIWGNISVKGGLVLVHWETRPPNHQSTKSRSFGVLDLHVTRYEGSGPLGCVILWRGQLSWASGAVRLWLSGTLDQQAIKVCEMAKGQWGKWRVNNCLVNLITSSLTENDRELSISRLNETKKFASNSRFVSSGQVRKLTSCHDKMEYIWIFIGTRFW